MGLFHYTDLGGLKGMLESKSLWATNLYFLNDRNEAVHGYYCFENTIKYLDDKVISQKKKEILQNALNACKGELSKEGNTREKNIYNISFCLDSDKLSQWRGYGAHQGVCIEFDKDELIYGIDSEGMRFKHDKVNYCSEISTVEMNESINLFFQKINLNPQTIDDNFVWYISAFTMINQITPFFKNDGFSEENEYRFIFSPDAEMMDVKFRVNANGLIPYISVGMKGKAKLPIPKIIIGPAKDPDFIVNGIKMLLLKFGYQNVDVEISKLPYRG